MGKLPHFLVISWKNLNSASLIISGIVFVNHLTVATHSIARWFNVNKHCYDGTNTFKADCIWEIDVQGAFPGGWRVSVCVWVEWTRKSDICTQTAICATAANQTKFFWLTSFCQKQTNKN